jgi:hypothetical protein
MKIDSKGLVIAGCCGFIASLIGSLVRSCMREYKTEDRADAYKAAYESTNKQLIECRAKLSEYES